MNAYVDRLARRLSETHLSTRSETNDERRLQNNRIPTHDEDKKAWIHFPPGTTLDEQLLILGAGKALLQRRPEHGVGFASTQNMQDTMSARLNRLPTSVAGTALLTQDAAEHITVYNSLIARDWSANTLSHAVLPRAHHVLEDLSRHMADEVYKRY